MAEKSGGSLGGKRLWHQITRKLTLPRKSVAVLSSDGILEFALLFLAVVIIGFMGWLMYHRIEETIKKDVETALSTIVKCTTECMDNWIFDNVLHAEIWASSPQLVSLVKKQIELPRQPQVLLVSASLSKMRRLFHSAIQHHGFQGFYVITPDSINIAGLRDSELGCINPLARNARLFSMVLQGKSWFTLPMVFDVHSPESAGGVTEKRVCMFFAAPVRDENYTVIAILALQKDPHQGFSHIVSLGRLGKTGETYAFNREGKLITRSRFTEQLYKIGLLEPGATSILSVELRDPGVNLVEGSKSALERSRQPWTFMAGEALAGKSGANLDGYRNYRGVPVVGAWIWNEKLGFGMATEMEVAEAFVSLKDIGLLMLLVFGVTVMLFLSLTFMLSNSRKKAISLAEQATAANDRLQQEINVRKRVEEIQRQNEEYIRAVVNTVMEGIITTSESGAIETINPTAEQMFGYKGFEIIGENIKILLDESSRKGIESELEKYLSTGKSRLIGSSREILGRRKDGSTFPMELSISEIDLADHRKLVAITHDITKYKELEQKLLQLSVQDGLTGIANRRAFDNALRLEWKRAQRESTPLSLIMIDIDFFKNYNDTCGHLAGDETLKKIAATLEKSLKRPADLAARYGGEEFAVLLPNTKLSGAALLAEKLRLCVESLQIPHPDSKINRYVTISLGVASVVPTLDMNPEQLVSIADKALYEAKGMGRNRVKIMA